MFRRNSSHNQFSMFKSTNWMSPRVKEKLKKSWAPVFYVYYSEQASDISPNVEVNFTDMTGKKPVEKIPVTDFELDATNVILKCPKGIILDRAVIKDEQTVAHFPIDCCKNCEYSNKCPSKIQKKSFVVRISSTTLEAALQRLKYDKTK